VRSRIWHPQTGALAVACVTLTLVSLSGLEAVHAQADEPRLRQDIEAQYEVTPIRGGIALLPRVGDQGVTLIELRDGAIFVDGGTEPRSTQELASTLGADAALLLRLTYLDPAAQRAVLGLPVLTDAESAALGLSVAEDDEAVEAAEVVDLAPTPEPTPERQRRVVRRDIVRFGGSARVDADERVRGDVVVIGGSLDVEGEVHGDITVIGGSARFGPEAIAHREVTVVGGRVTRAPGARFSRGVNEVSFDMFDLELPTLGALPRFRLPRPSEPIVKSLDLVGTIIRLAFVGLLGSLLLLVAGGSAQRVASRVTREPVKAGIVGFLAQLLFVPLLVVGSVLLAVTIIGIPLLVLVPVVVVAALAVMLLGFTGVAQGVGQLVTRGDGSGRWTAVAVFWLGLVLLMIPTLSGEALSLAGGSFRVIAITLGLVGFVVEYAAWTTGVGAVILNRFGASAGPQAGPPPVPVPPPVEPGLIASPLASTDATPSGPPSAPPSTPASDDQGD
jgi:hypothetical protein